MTEPHKGWWRCYECDVYWWSESTDCWLCQEATGREEQNVPTWCAMHVTQWRQQPVEHGGLY